MVANRPTSPGASRADSPRVALQRMLGQCAELLQRDLPPLLDQAMRSVDDALYELADKAESNHAYAGYFEAQRQLRHQRANVKRRFLRNLADGLVLFQDAARSLRLSTWHSLDSEDLALVAEKDLEESLVLTNVISKAETRYIRPLRDLTCHFSTLLGRPDLNQRDIPVSPTAIAEAFASALRSVDSLEISTLLIAYKIFDRQVMDHLQGYYAGCVEFAVAQGLVPPSSGRRIVKNPDGKRSIDAQPAAASAASPARTAGSRGVVGEGAPVGADSAVAEDSAAETTGDTLDVDSRVGQGTFETLQQILAGARRADGAAQAGEPLATEDLIVLLSQVQPDAPERMHEDALAPNALRAAVGARLHDSAGASPPRRLAPNDEDTMDLVFLLFEQVLVGGEIPDAIKVLVSRLQIPYVKVALLDRRFFDEPDHPARSLLNRIAEAAIGWNEGDRDRDDGLYARLDHLVQRVVTELHTDPNLFAKLERQFTEHLRTEQSRAATAERRVVQQAAARNVRRSARRRALALLDRRASQLEGLPPIIRTILYEGWLEAMVQADAEADGQGQRWRAGERILDDLLWSVAPKHDAAERRELLRRIPELLRDLRGCLSPAMADQQRMSRWLKELQTVHVAALRGRVDTGADALPSGSDLGQSEAQTEWCDTLPNDADDLPIGCWLGVARDDGSVQRFKLAWRGEGGDPLLFVDRLGRRGFELPKADLDALLAQDLATAIGTGAVPIVDRAMQAVQQSLTIH